VVLGNRIQGVRAVFAYGAITRSGGTFQILQLTVGLVTPRRVRSSSDPAPQLPIGNACGLSRRSSLGFSPFARRYLGNRGCFLFLEVLRCFSSLGSLHTAYGFSGGYASITSRGFPHSGIRGSMPACGFPRLIAACHALHRFLAPRHPPSALSSLTTDISRTIRRRSGFSRIAYSVVKEPRDPHWIPNLRTPGGDDRIRTGDPLRARQVLSQLSYIPQVVGLPGIEPGTSRLSSARSNQLS
jgi:hypothetical protein